MTATYDLFLHNWASSVVVSTSWRTLVNEAGNLAEERIQLWSRPSRLLKVRWSAIGRAEAQRILQHVLRAGTSSIRVPLYSDAAVTTASSSSTTINCPTATRRFAVGARVAIASLSGGRIGSFEWGVISAVGGSSLTLSGSLSGTFPAGSLVFPVIVAQALLGADVPFPTAQITDLEITFREVLDSSAIGPLTDGPGDWPTGTQTESVDSGTAYPILAIKPDWGSSITAGFVRPGQSYELGRGFGVYGQGTRGLLRWGCEFLISGRADAWELLEFFDACRGRTGAFWWPFPANVWEPLTYTTGYVEIEAAGNIEDLQELVSHFAVEFTDGTVDVRAISSVALQSGKWRITPTEALPSSTLASVRRITPAALVRFEDDVIEEEWITSGLLRTRLVVRELVNEGNVLSISDPEACA